MKVGIAQINPIVGDFEGNSLRIVNAYRFAVASGADLVVFPERCLTGLPCLDLLRRESFVNANLRALADLAVRLDGPSAIVGFVQPDEATSSKALFDAVAVVSRGRVAAVRHKAFVGPLDASEDRSHFSTATDAEPVSVDGLRFGIGIGEDLGVWSGDVRFVVNVQASRYTPGSWSRRVAAASGWVAESQLPLVSCNLVGGNDGLVFDGRSLAMRADGALCHAAPAFVEHVGVVDLAMAPEIPVPEPGSLVDALTLGIRDFCTKLGCPRVIVGLSGGIDSAVVAALAVRALGAAALTGVAMPSRHTSAESFQDVADLVRALGIRCLEIPIDDLADGFTTALGRGMSMQPSGLTIENFQARIRGTLLMGLANQENALVLNTGNKSEGAAGYCTLYGDAVGALGVLGDLTKDQVYAVAHALNAPVRVIPEHSITRAPSAELRPGQRDDDSLPPYPSLDPIVRLHVEQGLDRAALVAEGFDDALVTQMLTMIARSEFKRRQVPPAIVVSERAFGHGHRLPVVQRFREDA